MPTTTIDSHEIHVDDEGFMTQYDEWTEELGKALAAQIGVEMSDEHWKAIRFRILYAVYTRIFPFCHIKYNRYGGPPPRCFRAR